MFMKHVFKIITRILFLILFFLPSLKSFDIELRGLFHKPQFSGFNDYHTDLFSYSFSIDVQPGKINEIGGIELLFGIPVRNDFSICACLSIGMSEWTDDLFDEYHKKTAVRSVARFVVGYAGIGAKYFLDMGMERFRPYLFCSAGIFKHINSYWEISADTTYYFVNPEYGYQKTNMTGLFPGMDFEIGFDWRIFDLTGLTTFTGYKYGVFKLEFPGEGLFSNPHYQNTDVDISGFYFGGGVKFYFDEIKRTKKDELKYGWDYYNTTGDRLIKNKDYKGAVDNFLNAIKQSGPENIYKKIAFCFYKLNNIKMAVLYAERYLEFFPQDLNMKKWVEKHK